MYDDEKHIVGFRRVKAAYIDYPHPFEVWDWCIDENVEKDVPERVQQALDKLDTVANNWPLIDELDERVGGACADLTRRLLGLDFDDRRQRLRAAVARACQASWRYADSFCDWRDAFKNSNDTLAATEKFMIMWEGKLLRLGDVRKKTGFYDNPYKDDPHELIKRSMSDLRNFVDDTKSWTESALSMADSFPTNSPTLFLYTRLIEIYVCCSGCVPPAHSTGRNPKSGLSQEQIFFEFFKPALTVCGFPIHTAGVDGVLRDIAKSILVIGYSFEPLGENKRVICYVDFPSTGLLNGLNCFSETEL